jgi:hypothetical protein
VWLIVPPLLVLPAIRRADPVSALCGAWITLYVLVMGVLLRTAPGAVYAPLVGPAIMLAAISGSSDHPNQPLVKRIGMGLMLLAGILSVIWLATPAPANPAALKFPAEIHTIGVNSVQRLSSLDLTPDQSVIAFDGQLQPELKAMIERGDTRSALIRYAPDVLILTNIGRIQAKDLRTPSLARLGYVESDQKGIYSRTMPIGQFRESPASISYGPDIQLTGFALDQASVAPNGLVRVRLDWQFGRPATKPVTIDIQLVSGEFILSHSIDSYDPEISDTLKVGPYSTYHTLTVDKSAWAGPADLQVTLLANNGIIARAVLTDVTIVGN